MKPKKKTKFMGHSIYASESCPPNMVYAVNAQQLDKIKKADRELKKTKKVIKGWAAYYESSREWIFSNYVACLATYGGSCRPRKAELHIID